MRILCPAINIALQILYDGHHHWVTIVYIKGVLRHYYDSVSRGRLTAMLKASITPLFGSISTVKVLAINCPSVQQQKGGSMNCGVFEIAYAYHAARGDDASTLKFDESGMRNHLLNCWKANYLSPFPLTAETSIKANPALSQYLYCEIDVIHFILMLQYFKPNTLYMHLYLMGGLAKW